MDYDVVVVGLGAMGSAAVHQLAAVGARVLGLDIYAPPHALGSTHGDTRITRVAVGEGLDYVPLVRRSHELWRGIEARTGADLLTPCGGLVMAPRPGRPAPGTSGSETMHGSASFLDRTVAAAEAFDVEHRLLTAAQVGERFPHLGLSGTEVAYEEPGAGYLRPESCVAAQLGLAAADGATLRYGERVLAVRDDGGGVTVTTTAGTVRAATVVVTAGPWLTALLPDLAPHLRVFRQVLYWFDLEERSQYDAYAAMPVYIWWGGRDPDDLVYGFPMVDGPDGGAKVAGEQYAVDTTPDRVRRDVTDAEIDAMYDRHVRHRLPGLGRRLVKAAVCLYTVTPDSRFIIDAHPSMPNVLVASPCSGHGFKHSAAIGECLAQLATTGSSAIDLSGFRYPEPAAVGWP